MSLATRSTLTPKFEATSVGGAINDALQQEDEGVDALQAQVRLALDVGGRHPEDARLRVADADQALA
jgi:hypothetical protein